MLHTRHGPMFTALLLALAVFAVAFVSRASAGEYTRTIRDGMNSIVIPQDAAETRRLFGDKFQYVKRDHLVFISDLDQQTLTRLVLQDFQTYLVMLTRQLFTRALNSPQKDGEIPIVFLFKDRDSYVKGLKDMGVGAALGSGTRPDDLRSGYHFSAPGVSFILIDYQDNYGFGLAVFAHELTHALIRMEYPDAPIWLNEGLATLFENSKVEGGQLRYRFSPGLAQLLRNPDSGGILPLERLFASTSRDFLGSNPGPFYSSAELLCRYLQTRNALIPLYTEMRVGRGKGTNGSETAARLAGGSLEALEKNWHQWLREQGKR